MKLGRNLLIVRGLTATEPQPAMPSGVRIQCHAQLDIKIKGGGTGVSVPHLLVALCATGQPRAVPT